MIAEFAVVAAATLASSAAAAGDASPRTRCACHDALAPQGAAPTMDLRGWLKDGPHLKLGCEACHPGGAVVPHHPDRLRRVACESCHGAEAQGWSSSAHGSLEGRDPRIKGCLTCHAEHPFFRDSDPRSRYANTGLLYGCAHCHEQMPLDPSLVLTPKPAAADKPWPSSLHGLMADGDRRSVAACASCHGPHQVFPTADQRSAVNPARIAGTCGGCHPGLAPTTVAHRICRLPRGIGPALSNYFDIWYLWGGGVVVLSLAGVGGALGAGAFLQRRSRTVTSDRGRSARTD